MAEKSNVQPTSSTTSDQGNGEQGKTGTMDRPPPMKTVDEKTESTIGTEKIAPEGVKIEPKSVLSIIKEMRPKLNFSHDWTVSGGSSSTGGSTRHKVILRVNGETCRGNGWTEEEAQEMAAEKALMHLYGEALLSKNEEILDDCQKWLGSYGMHLLLKRWQAMIVDGNNTPPPSTTSSSVSDVSDVSGPPSSANALAKGIAPGKKVNYAPADITNNHQQLEDHPVPPSFGFPSEVLAKSPLYIFNWTFPNVPKVQTEDTTGGQADERYQAQCMLGGIVYKATGRSKNKAAQKMAAKVLNEVCGIVAAIPEK